VLAKPDPADRGLPLLAVDPLTLLVFALVGVVVVSLALAITRI
jgi:hypothetical protein